MRFIPDWIIYGLALIGLLAAIYSFAPRNHDAPPPPPEAVKLEGAMLPPESAFDNRVLVQVSRPKDGIGTAFAINNQGDWLTARHVVEGCESVSLLVAPNKYMPATGLVWSEDHDLALIRTDSRSTPVVLDMDEDLRLGEHGFHIGYPQGRPGEAVSRLISRARLITGGAREGEEAVLTWGETGRTAGLIGALSGLSGGPVFDSEGMVRGVIIAESPRRGKIYSAPPAAMKRFLDAHDISARSDKARPITPESYGSEADLLRRELQVVKVACEVEEAR